jgi:hypothetical protein
MQLHQQRRHLTDPATHAAMDAAMAEAKAASSRKYRRWQ